MSREEKSLWEEEARKFMEDRMKTAEWDFENKTVSIESEVDLKHGPIRTVCKSLVDLQSILGDAGFEGWDSCVPYDGGSPVFEYDQWGDLEVVLGKEEVLENLKKLGWEKD